MVDQSCKYLGCLCPPSAAAGASPVGIPVVSPLGEASHLPVRLILIVSVLTVSIPVLLLCGLPGALACLGSPWAYDFCIQPSITRMSPVGSSVCSIPLGLCFTCFSFHSDFLVASSDKDMILIALCSPPPQTSPHRPSGMGYCRIM